jgi:sugar lactone lactonase YvrE
MGFASITSMVAAIAFCAASASADVLYVSNWVNDGSPGQPSISQVDASGVVTPVVSGLMRPEGLAFDSSGNLYVALQVSHVIDKITTAGVGTFATVPTNNNSLGGLAFDAAGNLYVSLQSPVAQGGVDRIGPTGVVSPFATNVGNPQGLAFDAAGSLYVADLNGGRIERVSTSGAVSTFATGINGATGLAFDRSGNLFASEQNNNAIVEISPSGTVSTYMTGVNQPWGIAFDTIGNLYVANSPALGSGTTITQITPGKRMSTFATGFNGPFYIADPSVKLPIPEPDAIVIGGVFCGCLLLSRRRAKPTRWRRLT